MANRIYIGLILFALAVIGHAENSLEVRLTNKARQFSAEQDVIVTVEFKNAGDETILINKPAVPSETLADELFEVTLDGVKVNYVGPVNKRAAPSAAYTLALEPGKSITGSMSLSSSYDLSKSGKYEVQYALSDSRVIFSSSTTNEVTLMELENVIRSNTVRLDIDGRLLVQHTRMDQTDRNAQKRTIQFSSCSPNQTAMVTNAIPYAILYAGNAQYYLSVIPASSANHYRTWFGKYSASRWLKGQRNFGKIRNALLSKNLIFYCNCTEENMYSWVYPDIPYGIHLCPRFWQAGRTGTDSQAGTLIHEMSGFKVVASTLGYEFGQESCMELARNNATLAIKNADSYEYFAENNPPLF